MSRDFTEIEDYPSSVTEAQSAVRIRTWSTDPSYFWSGTGFLKPSRSFKTGYSPWIRARPWTFEKVRVRVGLLMTRHTVLVTVNSVATFRWQHFTDYHPTENPFILNSDQSEHVLPIFRFWVFQSIQFSGRISKSPKFVLVRIDFFVMTHRGEQKLGWKKGWSCVSIWSFLSFVWLPGT